MAFGRTLNILVEDGDDRMFFKRIIEPLLRKKYKKICYYYFANRLREAQLSHREIELENFIVNDVNIQNNYLFITESEKKGRMIRALNQIDQDYILVTDKDNYCISGKKQKIMKSIKGISSENIFVVVYEIESWYAAGYRDSEFNKTLGVQGDVEKVVKELFVETAQKMNFSVIELKNMIIDDYDNLLARSRCKSFDYFCRHMIDTN